MAATFGVKLASTGQFYFNLMLDNGEILLSSELYNAQPSAENGVASVKKNSGEAGRYEKQTLDNGRFRYVLKATNGQIVGHSPMYANEADRDSFLKLTQAEAPKAKVADLTDKAPK